MESERIDQLLEVALETGHVPAEASADERTEIERLLGPARSLRIAAGAARGEATGAMPIARARFERFLAAEQRAALPVPATLAAPRPRLFARLLGGGFVRRQFVAGALGVVGLLAVAGLVGSQILFQDVESASALVPGDYAQVTGVVSSVTADGGRTLVHVDSELGQLDIDLSDTSSIVDGQSTVDLATIKPGTNVLVGGTVVNRKEIAARTLALSARTLTAPRVLKLKDLKELKKDFEGRVVSFSVAQDGAHGRVIIELSNGDSYVVVVDTKSTEKLLGLEQSLGAMVSVNALVGGVFSLEVAAAPPQATPSARTTTVATPPAGSQPPSPAASRVAPTPAAASLLKINGVISARDGNVLTVQTARGPVQVAVNTDTRILLGESGLTLAAIRSGEKAVGHSIQAQGGLDRGTGRMVADILVIGPKSPR